MFFYTQAKFVKSWKRLKLAKEPNKILNYINKRGDSNKILTISSFIYFIKTSPLINNV